MTNASPPALIIIDVQLAANHPKWGPRNNPEAEQRIEELLNAWRAAGAPVWHSHDCDILFNFMMQGQMVLEGEGQEAQTLSKGDAFVIPPGMKVRFSEPSGDVEWLEVALPGAFATKIEEGAA